TPVGDSLVEAIGDTILHLKPSPNRADCLSMVGVAREVAVLTGQTLRQPSVAGPEAAPPAADAVQVTIEAPDLCPRYVARIVRNVTVGPSPKWLQDRLTAGGMRPINNVVDV